VSLADCFRLRVLAIRLKRLLDVIGASMALVPLAAPLLVVALAIRLDSKGPAFFRQERVGRDGSTFRMWKLRTMTEVRATPTEPDRLRQDDARITRVGRALRAASFDELPQLVNVLRGEMSLVGPRPALVYQVAAYDGEQRRRLEMRPGLTSLAVVKGRNALPWEERIRLDVWYVDHWSLGLDARILFRTLWKVLVRHEGVYGPEGRNDPFVGSQEVRTREGGT